MSSTIDVARRARQIKAAATHLSFDADSSRLKEAAKLLRDLSQAVVELTEVVEQLERRKSPGDLTAGLGTSTVTAAALRESRHLGDVTAA